MEIKYLDQLLESILVDGTKYISHECKNLLPIGENYASIMLDVKIKIEKDGNEQIVYCVAKTTPTSELMRELFSSHLTFKKEILVYKEVIPTLKAFAKEKGVDNIMPSFPKCIGARLSLDSVSKIIDTDAVLLLENLKMKGFRLADRYIGFNEEETKLILKDLAVFHAVPLAFRLQRPKEFNEKIFPHLTKDIVYIPGEDVISKFMATIKAKLSTVPKLASLYPKLEEAVRKTIKLNQEEQKPNELYATLVHTDYWVNNTMLRYENGKAVENVFVDFQVVEYNSPSVDLVFFIYSSIQMEVLKDNVDYFVKYYFDNFVDTLKRLNCNTDKFTYDDFLEDMDFVGKNYQIGHLMLMLHPIYTKKGEATDLTTVQKENDFLAEDSNLHDDYVKKLHFLLYDFEKRGWL